MSVLLWILQGLLALHTAMGAVWKVANSERAVPSLNAIPHAVWQGLTVFELLCSAALVIPMFSRRLGAMAPAAATAIAVEMLVFSGLHLYSGSPEHGQMTYWLVVAAICAFVAYGRFVLRPIGK
jgi:hypothetical protein